MMTSDKTPQNQVYKIPEDEPDTFERIFHRPAPWKRVATASTRSDILRHVSRDGSGVGAAAVPDGSRVGAAAVPDGSRVGAAAVRDASRMGAAAVRDWVPDVCTLLMSRMLKNHGTSTRRSSGPVRAKSVDVLAPASRRHRSVVDVSRNTVDSSRNMASPSREDAGGWRSVDGSCKSERSDLTLCAKSAKNGDRVEKTGHVNMEPETKNAHREKQPSVRRPGRQVNRTKQNNGDAQNAVDMSCESGSRQKNLQPVAKQAAPKSADHKPTLGHTTGNNKLHSDTHDHLFGIDPLPPDYIASPNTLVRSGLTYKLHCLPPKRTTSQNDSAVKNHRQKAIVLAAKTSPEQTEQIDRSLYKHEDPADTHDRLFGTGPLPPDYRSSPLTLTRSSLTYKLHCVPPKRSDPTSADQQVKKRRVSQ